MTLFPLLLLSMPVVQGDNPPVPALPAAVSELQHSRKADRGRDQLAQMTIEQRVIVRVPMVRRSMPYPSSERMTDRDERAEILSPHWVERKGPRCVKLKKLVGAAITSPRGIDLLLRNDDRLRVRLGRGCRARDMYSGFYIQPHDDGELCAGRDRMLARGGADCEITDMVRLVPER